MSKIIAGTGHRPNKLGGYSPEAYDNLLGLATVALEEHEPSLVITGMALGWDTALAEAAFLLGIPYEAYIPFAGQESAWPESSQILYRNLLAKSIAIVECAAPGYAVWKMHNRNECMVEACDLVLALWDGSSGGTSNCIAYAKSRGKTVVNLWSNFSG